MSSVGESPPPCQAVLEVDFSSNRAVRHPDLPPIVEGDDSTGEGYRFDFVCNKGSCPLKERQDSDQGGQGDVVGVYIAPFDEMLNVIKWAGFGGNMWSRETQERRARALQDLVNLCLIESKQS